MGRVRDFDTVFHGTEFFINWCQEFEHELGNAGPMTRATYVRACAM
jgi:hypothetical protein